ncbi:MAG: glycerol kinase GlpK [Crocinitomicaceae bacterium]|jgi:glycerol kinase|tara:strand:+ start:6802 stop:8289 length:1488 start_codon:yes stop_codon:yes gene_type:complete
MRKFILSIDAGTTSSRALIFDHLGQEIAKVQHEFTQYFPKESWVEHDASEIWNSQKLAIMQVLSQYKISPKEIAALGITNQRETTVVWEKATGKPICNAIVWQDRRTSQYCKILKEKGLEKIIKEKTGLLLDPYFSGTKLNWILNEHRGAREKAEKGEILFGTIDSWLIWNLTNGELHVTDPSNASRTLLFNIHEKQWDQELLDLFEIPLAMLPKVVSTSANIGDVKLAGWDSSIPICAIAGDQQAALFGQLCFDSGDVKNTYGTGCFCMMNTGENPVQSQNNMLTTIAWELNGKTHYALEGSVFIGGALIQWLRDGLEIIEKTDDVEFLAETVNDNGGITFISALTGIGAPYWDPIATGAIFGITRGTKQGHIARAALEAIAMRSREIIIEMQKDSGIKFSNLKADGGASMNNLLMQIQANLLNTNVIRPKTTETTAIGIAFLAGLACGFWKDQEELKSLWQIDREFKAQPLPENKKIIALWNERITKIVNHES